MLSSQILKWCFEGTLYYHETDDGNFITCCESTTLDSSSKRNASSKYKKYTLIYNKVNSTKTEVFHFGFLK